MSRAMKELRGLSSEELLSKMKELRVEQFKLNAARVSGAASQDVAKFGQLRKTIARVQTLLREQAPAKNAKKSQSKATESKAQTSEANK